MPRAPEVEMKAIDWQPLRAGKAHFPQPYFKHTEWPKGSVILLSALCFLPGSVCAGATLPPQDSPATQESAAKIEIPFRFCNDNLVIVKATIGNLRNVNMIIDTGTSPSLISKAVAHKLKLPRMAKSLDTVNGTIQAESAVLPALDFGPLHAGSLHVTVHDLTFIEHSLGISLGGIIGLDVLSSRTFTIDYPRRRIAFGMIPPELKTVPFAAGAPRLMIRGNIDGRPVRLLVDSGTGGLVLYRNRFKPAFGREVLYHDGSILANGGMIPTNWIRGRVSVGDETLGARDIAIVDIDSDPRDEFDGLMGFAKMGFHRVSFDFENGRFGWD
jgi:predicted aspartyl protease